MKMISYHISSWQGRSWNFGTTGDQAKQPRPLERLASIAMYFFTCKKVFTKNLSCDFKLFSTTLSPHKRKEKLENANTEKSLIHHTPLRSYCEILSHKQQLFFTSIHRHFKIRISIKEIDVKHR